MSSTTTPRLTSAAARTALVCHLVLLSAAVHAPLGAAPSKCQDIPLRVTVFNNAVTDPTTGASTPSAIRSDGGGEYVNNGTSIKVCSGTNDAVVNLGGTKRTFTFVFGNPISGSVIQAVPGWVPGVYAATGWLNVRNITYSKEPFATHVGSTFTVSVDRATYRLGFKGTSPDVPNAPNLDDPNRTQADNTPFPSSPAMVYPTYPTVCGSGSMPRWLVRGTSPNFPDTQLQVGTLHKVASKPQGEEVHEGQYSMPFEMLIEALQCFAY